ncbi:MULTISPECIES: alpha/beta hydrolase [unclassified Actinomyces]|uniref:alpha/beta hydrolase n=2 Tax=Actinomyces TaxID=1654 RepID=UPI002016C130|nr:MULTISPECIES: alpha/beta hydrolase [unclassified Actinomyces]MCL3777821.1 alpha/beta hydrolase [Actinomyces sp. AC-20-1]MCL3789677.1 alpha/beta hydrolase [Actinomyces sp. 187325]MCL3792286.1 alpha/beta hydrolase [Actinomyces sp. 186855]MCL3794978.1 alpha/beta hydrolase [Actinomyces sp. 217892]
MSTEPLLETDLLGEPWVARRLPVTVSDDAPGADHAVLVHQREAVPEPGRAPRHARAVLYLHGRNDYFFQTWLADALLGAGYEFYALDLRTCGRSGVGYRSPHDVRDLRVHDEEISEAVRIIREEHGHTALVLNGHSTGGLQVVLWAGDHPGAVEAVTLNSPWLDLQAGGLMRSYGSALVDLLSRRDPDRIVVNDPLAQGVPGWAGDGERPADWAFGATLGDASDDLYGRTLHRRWGGEWDWDLSLKPSPSFPVRAGFMAAVRRAHRDVHHGLGIEVPVLLCCSTDSATGAAREELTPEEALRQDLVLDVRQMVARAPYLGRDVTVRQVPGGVHDLALSPEPARGEYLSVLTGWLAARLG